MPSHNQDTYEDYTDLTTHDLFKDMI